MKNRPGSTSNLAWRRIDKQWVRKKRSSQAGSTLRTGDFTV
jgi:hypothetical protein